MNNLLQPQQQPAPENNNNNQQQTKFPARDTVTSVQLSNLLGVINSLSYLLTVPIRDSETNIPSSGNPLDGGAKAAVEATVINACGQIDEILKDPSRWKLDWHEHLEYKLGEIYQQQLNFLRAQTAAVEEIRSPHYVYRPTLAQVADGNYLAFMGDQNDLENAVFGVGSSPAEAMRSFDQAFNGQVPEGTMKWYEEQLKKDNKDDNSTTDSK